jgi:hypothetical protein
VNAASIEAPGWFLRSVALRLWYVRLIDVARSALWPTALALCVLAVWHVAVAPVPSLVPLLLTANAMLAVLIRALTRRPSMLDAAAAADRVFAGRAVMTTAAQCLRCPADERSVAARIVLVQANELARREQSNIRRAIGPEPNSAGVTAIIPFFVAAVLLASPDVGHDASSDTTQPAIAASRDNGVRDHDAINALRRELAGDVDGAPTENAPPAQEVRQDTRASTSADGAVDKLPANAVAPRGITTPAGSGSGEDAGTASPGIQKDSEISAAQLAHGDTLLIESGGDARASSAIVNRDFGGTEVPELFPTTRVQAATSPEFARVQTLLTRSQAAYAERYLTMRGDTHE